MNKDLQTRLTQLEQLIIVQRDSLDRGYMQGMLNGMILAHSIFTDDQPKFVGPKGGSRINKVRFRRRK